MNSRLFARAVSTITTLTAAMHDFNHFAAEALVSGEQPTEGQAKELAELERRLNIVMDSTPEKSAAFRDSIAKAKEELHGDIPGLNGVPTIQELCRMAERENPELKAAIASLEDDIKDLIDRAERPDGHTSNGHHRDGGKGCTDKVPGPDHEIVDYHRVDADTIRRTFGIPLPPGVAGVVLARVKSKRSARPLTGEQIGELLKEKIESQR